MLQKWKDKTKTKIAILSVAIILLGILSYYLFLSEHKYLQLLSFFLYMCVACSIIPLPTPPFVIGLGQIFPPIIVAVTGGIGNCIAGMLDYYLVTLLFSKVQLLQKVENSRIFQKGHVYFKRFAFPCLLFTGFSPVPFEPFRVMAIISKYNFAKYILAIFIGRTSRYYLIALIGGEYREFFTTKVLLIMLAILILIYPIQQLFIKFRRD